MGRLQTAEAVAGVGSYELKLATGALHFSDGMHRLFGEAPRSFAPSLAWIDARSNPDDARAVRVVLDQAIDRKQPYHYTRRIRRADGAWRTLESHGWVVCDAAGAPIRMEGVVEDQTAQQQTQQALRYSEEEFRLFVTASSDVVYQMSADWQQMYHLTGKEFLADTRRSNDSWLHAYVPPPDQPAVRAAIARAIETKSLFEHEHRVFRADGSVGWVHSRAVPMLGAGGELLKWVGTARDITARKQAEQELLRLQQQAARHHADKYRTLFNSLDEGVCLLELLYNEQDVAVDYRFLEVNQIFEQQTGLADAPGRLGSEIAPGTEANWLEVYAQVVRTGQPVRFENYHAGTERWYEAYAARVGEAGSQQVCTVFDDITGRKQHEERQAFLLRLSDLLRPGHRPGRTRRAARGISHPPPQRPEAVDGRERHHHV